MHHTFENGSIVEIIQESELKAALKDKKPYTRWNQQLIELKKKNPDLKFNFKLTESLVNSTKFQIINFLIENSNKAFSRKHLLIIEEALVQGKKSGDIIQVINKTDQNGLQRFFFKENGIMYYSIPELIFTDKFLRKRKKYVSKEEAISDEKRIRGFFKDLSQDDYELGHKDPREPLTIENMVMQPSQINRSYKDNYIFDENGLPKCPNPEKLIKNPEKFYPNKEDRRLIYESLKKEFE